MAGGEVGGGGGFECAILFTNGISIYHIGFDMETGRDGRHTRQTTLPHLLHSPTRSLAHVLTFPETKCPASPKICHFWPAGFKAASCAV